MTGLISSATSGTRASRPSTLRRLAALAALVLAVAACGSGAALAPGGDTGPGAEEAPGLPYAAASAGSSSGGKAADEQSGRNDAATAASGPLIVRTGQLNLEVKVLDEALAAAEKAVTAAGGYVAGSQRQGEGDRAGATVTYRIPVDRWEATLVALRAVGVKVLAEQTSSEEVTTQVVDLGARIVNLRATEAALQAIMTKATKIPDILEVQAQLTGVRQEIEQLTAQKLSLEQRAAMGTLTVGFALPPVVAVAQVQEGWDPAAEIDSAAATLVGLGQNVVSAVIWIVIVLLPLALVLGIAVGVAWLLARRYRPRAVPPQVTDAPAA